MPPRRPTTFFILLALWLMVFAASSQAMIIAPILPRIGEALQVEEALLGTLIAAYGLAAGALALIAGPVSDRYGRRRILLAGSAAMAVALYLHALASSFATLLLARAAAGGAGGILAGASVAYVGDYFAYSRRGWANGWVMSGFALGQVVGIPLGTVLADRWGFTAPFLSFALAMTGAFVLTLFFVPQPEVELADERLAPADLVRKYTRLLARPPARWATLTYVLMFLSVSLFIAYFPTWLEARFSIGGDRIALMFLVGGLAAVVMNPVAGRLSDRFGRKPMILLSCVGFGVLMASTTHVLVAPWLAYVFFPVGMAVSVIRIPALQSLLTAIVPAQERGSLLSFTAAAGQVGFAAGGTLAGFLYAEVGYYWCTMASTASIAAMALVAWWGLPEPRE